MDPAAKPNRPALVLLTRPAADAEAARRSLARRGIASLVAPALVIEPHRLQPTSGLQATLATSRNALAALHEAGLASVPLYAVGEVTAAAARGLGFASVVAAEGDAEALGRLVASRLDPAGGGLLLASGEGYGLMLAASLRGLGFRVRRRVVYTAREAQALPPDVVDALARGTVTHAVLLSSRTATSLARLARLHRVEWALRNVVALVISPAVAAACAGTAWGGIGVADRPDEAAVLAMIEDRS